MHVHWLLLISIRKALQVDFEGFDAWSLVHLVILKLDRFFLDENGGVAYRFRLVLNRCGGVCGQMRPRPDLLHLALISLNHGHHIVAVL